MERRREPLFCFIYQFFRSASAIEKIAVCKKGLADRSYSFANFTIIACGNILAARR